MCQTQSEPLVIDEAASGSSSNGSGGNGGSGGGISIQPVPDQVTLGSARRPNQNGGSGGNGGRRVDSSIVFPNEVLSRRRHAMRIMEQRRRNQQDAVRNGRVQRRQAAVTSEDAACRMGLCESPSDGDGGPLYSAEEVNRALRRSGLTQAAFGAVFGPECVEKPEEANKMINITVRTPFNVNERPICASFR